MESYLMITQMNDFVFCPRSIYFHDVYRANYAESVFHATPQVEGRAVHQTIDEGIYSSLKAVITGMSVYSERYQLLGCIDILDTASGLLTERKNAVSAVWPGFRYQLYAQYYALTEMGYSVSAMRLHSLKNNRLYPVSLPDDRDRMEFEHVLSDIRRFSLSDPFTPNPNKCAHCIYRELCDVCPEGALEP